MTDSALDTLPPAGKYSRYEGKWVGVDFGHNTHWEHLTSLRLLIRNGQLMRLNLQSIHMPGFNLFSKLDSELESAVISMVTVAPTPAERTLERLEFGKSQHADVSQDGFSGIKVEIVEYPGDKRILILRASGKLVPNEPSSAKLFLRDLGKAFSSERTFIILNLLDVPSLDAEAVGDIVWFAKKCGENGKKLFLCYLAQSKVERRLVTSRLDTMWPHYETEEGVTRAIIREAV